MRWRRLFGLVPSRPGHPFGARELVTALAAYAIVLAFLAAAGARTGFANATSTAAGLFVLFAVILGVRFVIERRVARQPGVRRR